MRVPETLQPDNAAHYITMKSENRQVRSAHVERPPFETKTREQSRKKIRDAAVAIELALRIVLSLVALAIVNAAVLIWAGDMKLGSDAGGFHFCLPCDADDASPGVAASSTASRGVSTFDPSASAARAASAPVAQLRQ